MSVAMMAITTSSSTSVNPRPRTRDGRISHSAKENRRPMSASPEAGLTTRPINKRRQLYYKRGFIFVQRLF